MGGRAWGIDMKKTIKAWAMFGRGGLLFLWSIQPTRKEVIYVLEQNFREGWPAYRDKFGCRIRRITITAED